MAERLVGIVGGWVSALTITVVCAVVEPELLVAVNVKVVVAAGVTVLEVVPVTVPMPMSMLNEVAFDTVQERVED